MSRNFWRKEFILTYGFRGVRARHNMQEIHDSKWQAWGRSMKLRDQITDYRKKQIDR